MNRDVGAVHDVRKVRADRRFSTRPLVLICQSLEEANTELEISVNRSRHGDVYKVN